MKKIIISSLITIAIIFNTSYINATEYSVYLGGLIMPVKVSGFVTSYAADASEWNSLVVPDNKVVLPLSKGNRNGIAGGAILGWKTTTWKINPVVEIQILPGSSLIGNVLIGPEIKLKSTEKFNIALTPKIGYGFYTHDLGKLQTTGKITFVKLEDGTYLYPDDTSESQSSGFVSQTLISTSYELIKDFISINLEVGFSFSKFQTPEVKIKGDRFLSNESEIGTLNLDQLKDENGNALSITPEISTTGLVSALSITVKI